MADKKVGTLAKLRQGYDAARARITEINQSNKELEKVARENKRLASQQNAVAIAASQQNQALLKTVLAQNSRVTVLSTMTLSATLAAGGELGANGFIHWLATPGKDATGPNIVLRNLGFFEALPGVVLGAVTGGVAVYRAGKQREYGAGDEFLRQLGAAWLAIGMVRGGDALLKPMPTQPSK